MKPDSQKSADPRNLNDAFQRDVSGTAQYNANIAAQLHSRRDERDARFNKTDTAQRGNFQK